MRTLLVTVVLLAMGGCASGPTIRSNVDPSANFSAYKTYGYAAELGTNRGGYSTLITEYFKAAVSSEMELRGYRYSTSEPDLLVNFFAKVQERTDVYSTPVPAYGYYGYRYGLYSAWPTYGSEVSTVHYQVGTANIDVVDARANQLIWEGVAEGRLGKKALADPGATIRTAVSEIFTRFPVKPPGS